MPFLRSFVVATITPVHAFALRRAIGSGVYSIKLGDKCLERDKSQNV